jgi:2-succinyl-6-hydroxy-2,4-cyclohexadiene-1-carboxylate synthase
VILSGVQQAGKPGYPWLVFLHGFSGDCREWQGVGERLCDYPGCIWICRDTADPGIWA